MARKQATRPGRRQTPQRNGSGGLEYVFPAIRGVQAGHEFYVSMCPLRLISRIFLFDEDELRPEIRAQRALNRQRLPDIARYITDNKDSYAFSALTASIDGNVRFDAMGGEDDHGDRMGVLHVEMDAKFVINDGQHRRAAIELAIKEAPELETESIAVVFFHDAGLERSQQMFADLNRYAIRPSPSLGVLYDHRDELAAITKLVVLNSPVFQGIVEMEANSLSPRSRKLFTLSALNGAMGLLLEGREGSEQERIDLGSSFWEAVAAKIPEWKAVRDGELRAGEVRADFIHTHAIVLHALGIAGSQLQDRTLRSEAGLAKRLAPLAKINWSRSNNNLWEGRAMVAGRVVKSRQNELLTANVILKAMGLELPPDHAQAERALKEARK